MLFVVASRCLYITLYSCLMLQPGSDRNTESKANKGVYNFYGAEIFKGKFRLWPSWGRDGGKERKGSADGFDWWTSS